VSPSLTNWIEPSLIWSAASLFDFADDEVQTPVEKLQSLNNQINDGSIQFVKDGDTLSQIAQDNGQH
jgi:LysM repeat protein